MKILVTDDSKTDVTLLDPLTALYNRPGLEKKIREKIVEADTAQHKLALLHINMHRFKTINTSLGHKTGDLLLKEVATRLREKIGTENIIARSGNDEFIVILERVKDNQTVTVITQQIIDLLATIFHLNGHQIQISTSIGIACYPDPAHARTDFIQRAGIALHHAKHTGKNNFAFYSFPLEKKYRKLASLEHHLHFAIAKKEIYLTYQPVCDLQSGFPVGVEALLRWKHPIYGLISPEIFIPIAEKMGMITTIGQWALHQACLQGQQWRNQGYKKFRLAVNVSFHQVIQHDFISLVTKVLQETHFPAKNLELEITETAIVTHTPALKRTLKKLRTLGISISIDDFGTRYSFLTNLSFLPVNTFKIDQIFIKNITKNTRNKVIVKSLIALGKTLNMHVIAEGVQTKEQQKFLIENHCVLAQGYLFSNPLRARAMTTYLKKAYAKNK